MTGKSRIPCGPVPQPASGGVPATPSSPADKSTLRATLKAQRRSQDASLKEEWDRRIGAHLLRWCHAHRPAALGVYWPLSGEPDLHPAYCELADAGVRLALPVVLARDTALAFTAWTPGEAMVKDTMGVAVPAELRLVERPPVLLVPCLGFNALHFRLGYGGGYYDRTLAAAPRPLALGIAYANQEVLFDADIHDIPLNGIITEHGSPD